MARVVAARHSGSVGWLMIIDALAFYSLPMDPAATAEKVAPGAVAFRDAAIAAPRRTSARDAVRGDRTPC